MSALFSFSNELTRNWRKTSIKARCEALAFAFFSRIIHIQLKNAFFFPFSKFWKQASSLSTTEFYFGGWLQSPKCSKFTWSSLGSMGECYFSVPSTNYFKFIWKGALIETEGKRFPPRNFFLTVHLVPFS